ncbi:unnamed protein product [Adineta ricciae]|uniref:Carrier domain-containing protein n=2 Tax=Adineta ricciae TaxID=249248 RepID=A0A815MMF2_ADIRI|nr:unnamed protein product [Adineta ricciae]
MFDYITLCDVTDRVDFAGADVDRVSWERSEHVAKFDFMCTIVHDGSAVNNAMTCSLVCSKDLFDQGTVDRISRRFSRFIKQLFLSSNEWSKSPLYKMSIILPREAELIHELNRRQCEEKALTSKTIFERFNEKAAHNPQKIAVELDEQCLTYAELLYYVQLIGLSLLNRYNVLPGKIICQCMERSISMVIGAMAIEMVGAVYCPLSPDWPPQRFHILIKETKSRLILVHNLTHSKVQVDGTVFNVDNAVNADFSAGIATVNQLPDCLITPDSIAYVIFTSGSTGVPKAVQVRHRNFCSSIDSMIEVGSFSKNDIILQMARCSFDIHVKDLIGTLIVGATLVMLHPDGILDLEYMADIFNRKQITYMQVVPSLLQSIFTFLKEEHLSAVGKTFQSICSSGEALSVRLVDLMVSQLPKTCRIWNHYGPAETTIDATYHLVNRQSDRKSIPIGQPLPNYQCVVVDEFQQLITTEQVGELLVGGVGVFAGYLGRDDLTKNALVNIDGEPFYRTGDLVQMDNSGYLHYLGRKDYQIKLRGQRIELCEIEKCLLDTGVVACVVVKWNEHIVAYVQSLNATEEQLQQHCRSHLPPFMHPSFFVILEQLPLNNNGKIDRKSLPTPIIPAVSNNTSSVEQSTLSPLGQEVYAIFTQAFHAQSLSLDVSFRQIGGTSLDVIQALSLIRKRIYPKVQIGVLFENPTVRQLAHALERLLADREEKLDIPAAMQSNDDDCHCRLKPSLCIETIGVLLLAVQWLSPILFLCQLNSSLAIFLVPIVHLLCYVVCQRLFCQFWSVIGTTDELYSWSYYSWWFLDRLWSINNCYWLQHLVGTSLYNSCLRLCGAHIGHHCHIYTTRIDAPWLLEVGGSTVIGNETILSSLSFYDRTYKLYPISIGSYCSIGVRCVLYERVNIDDYVCIEPMSAIAGHVTAPHKCIFSENRILSQEQRLYQFSCVVSVLLIHYILLALTYRVYQCRAISFAPLSVQLALTWLFWIFVSLFVSLVLLKFVVGHAVPGQYSLNSYYYLHKIWLRRLIVSTFYWSFAFIPKYSIFSVYILRWLGGHIEDDVKLAEFHTFLYFPSNLFTARRGATTFNKVMIAPFEMAHEHDCCIDSIHVGSDTNLGNGCTLIPGAHLASNITVGNFTLVTRKTDGLASNIILLGIPGQQMPFHRAQQIPIDHKSLLRDSSLIYHLIQTSVFFLIGKFVFVSIYVLLPITVAPLVHAVFFCAVYRYSAFVERTSTTFTFSDVMTTTQYFLSAFLIDFKILICPLLARTQLLVFLFRGLGARIASDVILFDIDCLTDPQLVFIDDHVRFHMEASIQCHTFEQRILKLAFATVHQSTVLMSYSMVLSGAILHGQNRLLPYTLVMKNDELPFNTDWSGVPAQQLK